MAIYSTQNSTRSAIDDRRVFQERREPMSGSADPSLQQQHRPQSSRIATSSFGQAERAKATASFHATSPYPTFRRPSGPTRARPDSSSSSSTSSHFAPPIRPLSSGQNDRLQARPSSSGARPLFSGKQIRLPSLSAMMGDLPPIQHFPRGQPSSTPVRMSRSDQSRGSISSRGSESSPRSFSSGGSRFQHAPPSSSEENPNTLRSSADAPAFRYELVIRQQPGRAAAVGLSPAALNRMPIVPSPVLRLRVTDQHGHEVPYRNVVQSLPYLVCSCTLLSASDEGPEGVLPVDFVRQPPGGVTPSGRSPNPLAMLCGTRVYSAVEAVDMDGEAALFFIFWDMSVRQVGNYRLKFSLVEALPGSPTMATAVSDSFDTVPLGDFPGNVDIATDLSRHLHEQGLSIYLPPITLATGL